VPPEATQVPLPLQVPPEQTVPFAAKPSVGQLAELPLQFSATSQLLAAERQTVLDDANASAGQAVAVPLQVSATSHVPLAVRQTVPLAFTPSAGQAAEEPVQLSALSQPPFAARHTVLDDANASAGQAVELPVQVSAVSHAPAEVRHTVPALPAVCWHTWLASHASTVQGLPSSGQLQLDEPQTFAVPPPAQVAGDVQLPQLDTVREVPQLSFAVTLPQFLARRLQNAASVSGVHAPPSVVG
jgi:hypothetical protein